MLKIFLGLCVNETSVLVRSPESRKKFGLLKLFLQLNYQIIFFMIRSGLPGYQESTSMFKTSVQGL